MRSRRVRMCVMLGLVATTGMLFAGSGLACTSLALDQAASSVDFCFLFDCTQGAYGGLVEFCNEADPTHSLLADCMALENANQ